MHLCIRGTVLPLSTIFIFNLGTFQTVWYFFFFFILIHRFHLNEMKSNGIGDLSNRFVTSFKTW
jgi:hypothetical protein